MSGLDHPQARHPGLEKFSHSHYPVFYKPELAKFKVKRMLFSDKRGKTGPVPRCESLSNGKNPMVKPMQGKILKHIMELWPLVSDLGFVSAFWMAC